MVFIEKPMMDQQNMLASSRAFHTAICAVLVAWCGLLFAREINNRLGMLVGPISSPWDSLRTAV